MRLFTGTQLGKEHQGAFYKLQAFHTEEIQLSLTTGHMLEVVETHELILF